MCQRLQKAGVVVDSITVGAEKCERLKCLSLATGGYAFHPTTLRAALQLNELETVLSARNRAPRETGESESQQQGMHQQRQQACRKRFSEPLTALVSGAMGGWGLGMWNAMG